VMAAAQVRGHLACEQVLAHRNRKHTIVSREQTERIDGLLRVLLRPFDRGEVKEPVTSDRSAKAAAVLVPTVFLLVRAAGRRRSTHAGGASQVFPHRGGIR